MKNIISLAGSSGAGKTTLAKALGKMFGLTFMEQSAGMILSEQDKERLANSYGYTGNFGQSNVIKLSNENPGFALDFQLAILRARVKILGENDNMVLDRSPLDVLPFYLNQVVHHFPEKMAEDLIIEVLAAMEPIRGLIWLPFTGERPIEDNSARVANRFFQTKISALYGLGLELIAAQASKTNNPWIDLTHFEVIETWDWTERLTIASEFVANVLEISPKCSIEEITAPGK